MGSARRRTVPDDGLRWKTERRTATGRLVAKRRFVHGLKHTFGRRLRAAEVRLEDRKVLLGHTNQDITSHYSAVEIDHLIREANKVACGQARNAPTLTLLKRRVAQGPR